MEHKQARTNTLQDDIDNAIKEASEKALSLGQILSSVSNILDRYVCMCQMFVCVWMYMYE
jgi:hypothetical protein